MSKEMWRRSADGPGRYSVRLNAGGGTTDRDSLVFSAASTEGVAPRLVFDPVRSAFRAGESGRWDERQRGVGSVALGMDSMASGDCAVVAGGSGNSAVGARSVVMGGTDCAADGAHSCAVGLTCRAGGEASLAAGTGARADHRAAFVWAGGEPLASTADREVSFGAPGGLRVLGDGQHQPPYAEGQVYLDVAVVVATGRLSVTGGVTASALTCPATPDRPVAAASGSGVFWVRRSSPAVPMFTDELGRDTSLGVPREQWESSGGLVRISGSSDTYHPDRSLVFGSASLDAASSAGASRLVFDKPNAAFRAGSVDARQWDQRGRCSAALGLNTVATGACSFAAGDATSALGVASAALGHGATARHDHALVWSGSGDAASERADQVTIATPGGLRVLAGGSRPESVASSVHLDTPLVVATGRLEVGGACSAASLELAPRASGTGVWRSGTTGDLMFTDEHGAAAALTRRPRTGRDGGVLERGPWLVCCVLDDACEVHVWGGGGGGDDPVAAGPGPWTTFVEADGESSYELVLEPEEVGCRVLWSRA